MAEDDKRLKELKASLSRASKTERGRDQVIAFGCRACMRSISAASVQLPDELLRLMFLGIFRAVSHAWTTARYPAHHDLLAANADRAGDHADKTLKQFEGNHGLSFTELISSARYSVDTAIGEPYGVFAANAALTAENVAAAASAIFEVQLRGLAAEAIDFDLKLIENGTDLSQAKLWAIPTLSYVPFWNAVEPALKKLNDDWEVWTDWYEARLRGGPTHLELSAAANERIEVARVLEIEEEDWEQGPAHVNAKIKTIIERETERDQREHDETDQTASIGQDPLDHPPPEPDPGPGPNYSVREGQLHLDSSPPDSGDEAASAALLPLLQGATADLQQLCQKLDNTHPQLAEAVRNYAATLNAPFEGLSVPSVWAYGGLLAELRQGFEAQSPSTMTEALEPEVSAQLANVVRQHAAFILGTEQGRDLVERADRFQQAPHTIEEIREPAEEILDELSDNENLVDVATRAAHAPIRDHLRAIEWGACRTSYAGYLIVRKATFAMLRLVVGKEVSFISLLGATAAAGAVAGDPNLEFLRVALPVLRDHASAILAFYKHSPELRSYAEYALNLIEAAEEKLDPRVKPEDDAQ